MAERSILTPLEEAIAAISLSLKAQRIRGMIIGGVAASLLGRPRMTRDVDVVVWLEEPKQWRSFLTKAARHGIEPRIADVLEFASRSRVLLLRHVPSGIDVDVSLGSLPFEAEALSRAKEHTLGRLKVLLPSPEDLIVMKAIAHRPRDAADIEGILNANPSVNVDSIRRWLGDFAEALDAPELLSDFEALLRHTNKEPREGAKAKASARTKRGTSPSTAKKQRRR